MQRILDQLNNLSSGSHSLEILHGRISANVYLRASWFEGWLANASQERAIGLMAILRILFLRLVFIDKGAWGRFRLLGQILSNQEQFITFANNRIIDSIISDNESYFDTVEQNPLTRKQREAVASDEDATLVIAGAGTGKTSTIVAKIGLLIKSGQYIPNEILAVSFTKKSARDLSKRVLSRINAEVDVDTFHKLGLRILTQSEGGRPTTAAYANEPAKKAKFIQSTIGKLEDKQFKERLVEFIAYYQIPNKEEWEFESLAQYTDWLRSNKIAGRDRKRLISLDGKSKRSYQECIIANWLVLNGVRFEYEKKYEHSTKTEIYKQYSPDFYLPDANLYIEHFGINENGQTAPGIDAEKYRQEIEWKREIHKKYQTILIETYSWEHSLGVLESNLEHWLKVAGCRFSPISTQEALKRLNDSGLVNTFFELAANFLTLFKGNGNKIVNQNDGGTLLDNERKRRFLELFYPILDVYEDQNYLNQDIDFEDMILRATRAVENGDFKSHYRYILVDEFQDISPGRAAFLRALQKSNPDCALFAVGDDWQSIYRFTGSDIGVMTKFDRLFGPTRYATLDTTFRFDNKTIEVSSRFIQKNSAQIKKNLVANMQSADPSIIMYRKKQDEEMDWCLEQISKQAAPGASVLIMARNQFLLPMDKHEMPHWMLEWFLKTEVVPEDNWTRLSEAFTNLSLTKSTIHAAKGLEADYTVIGLSGGLYGLPSQLTDDPIFDLVLTQADQFPFGEERRIFYVALTRARKKTYLFCGTPPEQSVFATELLSENEYPISVFGIDTKQLSCPICKSGILLLRDGVNGRFYGCSNYPHCEHTEPTCEKCGVGLMINDGNGNSSCNNCGNPAKLCPKCSKGILLIKQGKKNQFYGCSNFKDPDINCGYMESLPPSV